MNEQTKTSSNQPSSKPKPVANANDTKSVSAQVPTPILEILAAGQPAYSLSKAGMLRLAILYAIVNLYDTKTGKWRLDESVLDLAVFANSDSLCHRAIK